VAIVFWTKFAADGGFRARLLQRDAMSWIDAVVIVVMLSFELVSPAMHFRSDTFYWLNFSISPAPIVLTFAIVAGVSRMRRAEPVAVLSALLALSFVGLLVGRIRAPPGLYLTLQPDPATIIVALACLLTIDYFRKQSSPTLLGMAVRDRRTSTVPPGVERMRQALVRRELLQGLRHHAMAMALPVGVLTYHFVNAAILQTKDTMLAVDEFVIAAAGYYAGVGVQRLDGKLALYGMIERLAAILAVTAVLFAIIYPFVGPSPLSGRLGISLTAEVALFAAFLLFGHMTRREPTRSIAAEHAPSARFGDDDDVRETPPSDQERVLRALQNPQVSNRTLSGLALALRMDPDAVRSALDELIDSGQIDQVARPDNEPRFAIHSGSDEPEPPPASRPSRPKPSKKSAKRKQL
jgi:hypothetical protein